MKALSQILKSEDTPIVMVLPSRLVYDTLTRQAIYSQVYVDAFYIVGTDICIIWMAIHRIRSIDDPWPKNAMIRKSVLIAVIFLLLVEIALNLVHLNVGYDYFRRMTSNPIVDIFRGTVIMFYLLTQYLRYKWA